jgi:3-isopropylmalate dehydratase small subunit
MAKGTIFKFHNDLDTDQIIASQYLLLPNLEEMKEHAFESLDPDFPKKVKPGDFVVGGENFGCGSSREQAAEVLVANGVHCVIAKSFARIFFRNAINNGILLLECPDLPDDVNESIISWRSVVFSGGLEWSCGSRSGLHAESCRHYGAEDGNDRNRNACDGDGGHR